MGAVRRQKRIELFFDVRQESSLLALESKKAKIEYAEHDYALSKKEVSMRHYECFLVQNKPGFLIKLRNENIGNADFLGPKGELKIDL